METGLVAEIFHYLVNRRQTYIENGKQFKITVEINDKYDNYSIHPANKQKRRTVVVKFLAMITNLYLAKRPSMLSQILCF